MTTRPHRRRPPIRTLVPSLFVAVAVVLAVLGFGALVPGRRPDPGSRAFAEARARLAAGDTKLAVRLADLAFLALPDSPEAASLSALALASSGDVATALHRLEAAARRAPLNPEPALQAGLLARRLARDAPPGSVAAARLGALVERWFDEAVRRADAVRDASPDRFRARMYAACARTAQGRFDDALRRVTEAAPVSDDEREEAAIVQAAALAGSGDLAAAETRIEEAAARRPSKRLRDGAARLRELRRHRAVPPLVTGLVAAAAGQPAVAAARLGVWVDDHPADPVALAALAESLARTDDVRGAAERIDRLVGKASAALTVPYFRGLHLLASGRPAEALAALDAAQAAGPGDPHVQRARIGAMLELLTRAQREGDEGRALAEIGQLARHRPADAVPRLALGVAAELRGDTNRAEAQYRAALAADPACGLAANNLAWLLATRRRRPAEALRLADEAVRLCPLSAQVRDTRGWVRYLAGDAAAAEPDLAAACTALPHEPDVHVRHARVLAALGRTSDAREVLLAAVNRQPSLRADAAFLDAASACGLERKP